MPGSANTHWLNTLSMKLFLFLPGSDDAWKLRMLSMVSWPVYAFGVWKLATLFPNKWIGLAFYLTMLLNPYLLFFFSLGRGYAAACAAIVLSLWLVTEKIRQVTTEPRQWLPVFTWACIAVLCNFTSLYYLLALCIGYVWLLYLERGFNQLWGRKAKPLLHIVVSTICFSAASLLFIDLYSGDLEHGGKSDLTGSLFGSLISNSLYVRLPAAVKTVSGFVILVALVFMGIYNLYLMRKVKTLTPAPFLLLLMLLVIGLNFGFHLFFGIPYLLDRTTLIIFPLLLLCLFLIVSQLVKKIPNPVVVPVFLLIILFAGYNFFKSFSLNYFKEWRVQENSIVAYDFLQQRQAQHVAMDIWQYSVLHNYYRHAYPGRFSFSYEMARHRHLTDSTGTALKHFDYLLLSAPVIGKNPLLDDWKVVLKDSISGLTLLTRAQR